MKKTFLLLLLSFSFIFLFAGKGIQEINALLGDQSYIVSYGKSPAAKENDVLRIQTHLAYVENLLVSKLQSNLDSRQLFNRKKIIGLLHEYWTNSVFPSNYDYPEERRPCFIDEVGNICAVGFLIEKTKGREVAEQINRNHKYEYILEMNEPLVNEWAQEHGLTLEECAMIQPAYGPPPPPINRSVEIKTSYGVSSGVVGGINLAATIANFSYSSSNSPTFAYIGLLTGATQIVMGATNIKQPQTEYYLNGQEVNESYKAQNNLSYVNIAMGTTTILSSALRLAMNKKNKDIRNTYSLYSYPNYSNSMTFGIGLKRRI